MRLIKNKMSMVISVISAVFVLSAAASSPDEYSVSETYTTTWRIKNMQISGNGQDKTFSFDVYVQFTGAPEDFKLCGHSLRILFNGDELENPSALGGLSVFYARVAPLYKVQWDTMGYFYVTRTTAGDDDLIVLDLGLALMDGMYVDQGYSDSLLPLESTDGEQLLCRVRFDVRNGDTFTLSDAGLIWDDDSLGYNHFDSSVSRKMVDEQCQIISDGATYEVEGVEPTPTVTPTITTTPTVAPTMTVAPTLTPPDTPKPTLTPTLMPTSPPTQIPTETTSPPHTPTATPTNTFGPTLTPTPTSPPTQIPTETAIPPRPTATVGPGIISTPTPTIAPTMHPSNYVNLTVAPVSVRPGGVVNLSYSCDFSEWDYKGVPVDVYLAAIRGPVVDNAPSSVRSALAGGRVYLFGRNMKTAYLFRGIVRGPTFARVPFPPVAVAGTRSIRMPRDGRLLGGYVFAVAFIRKDTSQFVRMDGLPVENSNLFICN